MISLGSVLLVLGAGTVVTVFVLFPEARALGKGFTRLFIKNMAETPEGAEAIFTEKINEAQDRYNRAQQYYTNSAGKLETTERDLKNAMTRFENVEKQCERLVQRGEIELAKVKAEERASLIEDIRRLQTAVEKYKDLTKEAQEVTQLAEKELVAIKEESKRVVQEMKDNQNIADLYKEMDELRADSGVDKLLSAVRDKNQELAQQAAGSKVVHQNKLSTKIENAERKALEVGTNDYINSLMNKYGNPQIEQKPQTMSQFTQGYQVSEVVNQRRD